MADASWEVEVTRRVQSASPDALHQIARFMTVIGRSPISTLIPIAAIVAMWVWGQRHLSIFLAAAARKRERCRCPHTHIATMVTAGMTVEIGERPITVMNLAI